MFLLGAFLGALALFTISLQRTYSSVPLKELRRRARKGDPVADSLYKAAAYGISLRTLLWVLVWLFNALFFILVVRLSALWVAALVIGFMLWLGFSWLPAQEASSAGTWLASRLSPALAWLLQYIHPMIDRVHRFVRNHRPIHVHTGLYERADVLDLLDQQAGQTDNRIDAAQLEIARNALTFADKTVGDVMTPRRVVKMVNNEDDLGPILMAELHDSGFSRFPVYAGKQDNIVGTLFLRDLLHVRKGGKVSSKQRGPALYLHEEQSLYDALQAILKTHHHLFVVVNSFEEYAGIITIEDVLEQIVGEQIVDEFDEYEDMRAVAKITARKQHKEHTEQNNEAEKEAEAKTPEADETIEME